MCILCLLCSNVQLHPGDDTYRRVRVSSQRFDQKVWQFSDASQFLARAGWVEVSGWSLGIVSMCCGNSNRKSLDRAVERECM